MNEQNMIKILLPLEEIYKPKDKKTDKQSDATDIPELENEESAEQTKKTTSFRFKNFNIKPNA